MSIRRSKCSLREHSRTLQSLGREGVWECAVSFWRETRGVISKARLVEEWLVGLAQSDVPLEEESYQPFRLVNDACAVCCKQTYNLSMARLSFSLSEPSRSS